MIYVLCTQGGCYLKIQINVFEKGQDHNAAILHQENRQWANPSHHEKTISPRKLKQQNWDLESKTSWKQIFPNDFNSCWSLKKRKGK